MNNTNPVLACYDLSKSFTEANSTIHILNQVNFAVNSAEMIAIVGNSGSGKSTLLHLLGGLDKPTSGKVLLNGADLQLIDEKEKCELRNRNLGFVYQFHHLLPEFSALENVGMPLLIQKADPKIIKEKSEHLLEQVGLQDRLHHRLGQLSGGERQRVAIARALVADPICVLADEPTGNLDPVNTYDIIQILKKINDLGTTIILTTHNNGIIEHLDKRVITMQGGKVAHDTHPEVKSYEHSNVTRK